jgi:hypothetical protein
MLLELEAERPALANVEWVAERYPDIPLETIFKEDLLRRGMAWSSEAWGFGPLQTQSLLYFFL